MAKLTAEQADRLIALLKILADPENQPWDPAWGERVFGALTHVITPVSIEVVALNDTEERGVWEVFLTQRPNTPDEPYPGQWHSPGTFVYASDGEVPQSQIARLEQREVAPGGYGEAYFAGVTWVCAPPRGLIVNLVYCARLYNEPSGGQWFRTDALPDTLFEQHREVISIATGRALSLFGGGSYWGPMD